MPMSQCKDFYFNEIWKGGGWEDGMRDQCDQETNDYTSAHTL